jgi:hypothetical protein
VHHTFLIKVTEFQKIEIFALHLNTRAHIPTHTNISVLFFNLCVCVVYVMIMMMMN